MGRVAYVNGRYVPHDHANVHIEDRGYQFADGVYEVVPVSHAVLIDEEPHLDRLGYSLAELRIDWPVSRAALKLILREVMNRNQLVRGLIYFQVSRGVAPRDHKFPTKATKSSLIVTTKRTAPHSPEFLAAGVSVSTQPDIRWERCDIKSLSLLPNILAKQAAHETGAFEAWLVDADGRVTEGSSTNAWIVTHAGEIVTHPKSHDILGGITRQSILQLAQAKGLTLAERGFTLDEARGAAEAFLTSSSAFVLPVVRIDGQPVADGKPGPITKQLRMTYINNMTQQIFAARPELAA